ncbi:MAG: MFS transporter [Hyphomicrobiaceae bacterium]
MRALTQQFAARVGAFFGALFLVYGAALPYLPVLLDARGLDAAEIGLVSAVPMILRLVLTPAIALHADRRGDHRAVVIALSVLALAAILMVAVARGFWPILLCVAAFQIALQSIMPLIETIAMAGVRRHGHDYGRMRLVGSVTFIFATFAGAWLIERRGSDVVALMLIAATASTLAMAILLPMSGGDVRGRPRLDRTTAMRLASQRPVVLFLIAAGAVQAAHAVFYGFGVLHWRSAGIASGWIGALWSIGVLAEIVLFWWAAAVLRRIAAVDLIWIGAAAAVLRWTIMAFDPPLSLLVPLQLLHGLTYGASHLGAMHYIKGFVPEAQAGAAQALYSTATAGIGMGGAMILAGIAYREFAGLGYLAMATLALISLAAATALRRAASEPDRL